MFMLAAYPDVEHTKAGWMTVSRGQKRLKHLTWQHARKVVTWTQQMCLAIFWRPGPGPELYRLQLESESAFSNHHLTLIANESIISQWEITCKANRNSNLAVKFLFSFWIYLDPWIGVTCQAARPEWTATQLAAVEEKLDKVVLVDFSGLGDVEMVDLRHF